jgi:S1-C subfamily serine protease
MVASVDPGSPAAQADIRSGDVILGIGGRTVTGADDLVRLLTGEQIGQTIEMELLRDGKVRQASVVPQERPPRKAA